MWWMSHVVVVVVLLIISRIGASGTGRTTFVNTLCNSSVLAKKVCDSPEEAHNEEGITIKPVSVGNIINLELESFLF